MRVYPEPPRLFVAVLGNTNPATRSLGGAPTLMHMPTKRMGQSIG